MHTTSPFVLRICKVTKFSPNDRIFRQIKPVCALISASFLRPYLAPKPQYATRKRAYIGFCYGGIDIFYNVFGPSSKKSVYLYARKNMIN